MLLLQRQEGAKKVVPLHVICFAAPLDFLNEPRPELDEGCVAGGPIVDRGTEKEAERDELIARAGDGLIVHYHSPVLIIVSLDVRENGPMFVDEFRNDVGLGVEGGRPLRNLALGTNYSGQGRFGLFTAILQLRFPFRIGLLSHDSRP